MRKHPFPSFPPSFPHSFIHLVNYPCKLLPPFFIRLGFKPYLMPWDCVRAGVRPFMRLNMGFVYESMYSHVYSVQWSPRDVPFGVFFKFFTHSNFFQKNELFKKMSTSIK